MNDFCIYCTNNNRKEIKQCDDKYCPFYPFRFGGIPEEDERELAKKLLGEVGLIK